MRRIALATTVGLAALGLLGWSITRYAEARSSWSAARARALQIDASVLELASLRAARPTLATGPRPQPNLAGQIADSLIEAGLPRSALSSLTPEPESQANVSGAPHADRKQVARLTLETPGMVEFGRFLAAWRTRQPEWTITSINLTPIQAPTSARSNEPGTLTRPVPRTDRAVRATLVMECVYSSRAPAPRSPT